MQHTTLPDVALDNVSHDSVTQISQVGMSNIEIPLSLQTSAGLQISNARAEATVNLIAPKKGIHMSRIYQDLVELLPSQPLTLNLLYTLTQQFLKSHKGLSNNAFLKLHFELLEKRCSLLSDGYGWRSYPVEIIASNVDGKFSATVKISFIYSSTCPCSAALSRQKIQEKFDTDFNQNSVVDKKEVLEWIEQPENINATPHSQRSTALFSLQLLDSNNSDPLLFVNLCSEIESFIPTTVQTMVKRQDEQYFAQLNASNLIFCEDAARQFKLRLEKSKLKSILRSFKIRVEHLESLHAHDAIAEISSDVPFDT